MKCFHIYTTTKSPLQTPGRPTDTHEQSSSQLQGMSGHGQGAHRQGLCWWGPELPSPTPSGGLLCIGIPTTQAGLRTSIQEDEGLDQIKLNFERATYIVAGATMLIFSISVFPPIKWGG